MTCPLCRLDDLERQIVTETAHFLLLAAAQPLVDGHLVLLPRAHVPGLAALPASLDEELDRLKRRAASTVAASCGQPTLVEQADLADARAHAQLHILPAVSDGLAAATAGRPIAVVGSPAQARAVASRLVRYIDWQGASTRLLVDARSDEAPTVLELLGRALGEAASPARSGPAAARWLRDLWQRQLAATGEPIEVVASLLHRDGRVCLFKRSPALDSAPGLWHAVSGYLPEGLDPLEHALAEIEQETGLRRDQVRLARAGPAATFGGRSLGLHWRIHPFLFDLLEGEPRLNWEHTDLAWVRPDEVARYPCVPWLPTLARQLLA